MLTTLPESIGDLNSLEVLSLRDNSISTIPESIRNLETVERLKSKINKNDKLAIIGLEDEMFKLGYSVDYEAEGEGVFYKFKEGSTFEETKDPDNRISFTDFEVIKDILINRFGMTHDPELDEYIHVN